MSDIYLCSGLVTHFAQRFKQYLLFLQFSNDPQLIQLLFSFLHLKDVLHFLATSSHFYELKKLQSVEIRILRGKVGFYEKPKEMSALDLWTHFLPVRLQERSNTTLSKIKEEHVSRVKFRQAVKIVKYLKKDGVAQGRDLSKAFQKKDVPLSSQFQDELQKQDKQLQALLQSQPKKSSWSQINQNQLRYFQQYREYFQENSGKVPSKKIVEYNSNNSRLETVEHRLARLDYERRKMKKMREGAHLQFISLEELRRLAQRDSCSRQILNRVQQQQKVKQQQQNIAKLRMRPTPNIQNIKVEAVQSEKEVKVLKKSIAGKVFSGIKNVIFMKKQ